MIIIKLMGGMGNQMFQYALGRSLAIKHNTTLKMDLSFLLDRTPMPNFVFRDYDLGIFNVKENIAVDRNIEEIKQAFDKNKALYPKDIKLKGHIILEPKFSFNSYVLDLPDNIYLEGYWQSEKYFKDIENIIRQDFKFKFDYDLLSSEMSEQINSSNAVCINVRRTDFINLKPANEFHGVCNMDYFNRAKEYTSNHVENPHYFVFSDDIEWCKENFIGNDYTVVGHEYAGEKFKYYLRLMTECKHFIIPNSTFGWWGAWLNNNPEKIVITPRRWFASNLHDTKDLIPEGWIKL